MGKSNRQAKSIGTSTYYSFLLLSITVLLLGLIATIFDSAIKYEQECELIYDTYISSQETLFRYHVTEAVNDVQYRIKKSSYKSERLEKVFLDYLSTLRFPNHGKNPGFFFVRSKDGTVLMSSSTPEVIGRNLSDVPGPDGIITHKLFMHTLEEGNGEGFADYSWYNPVTGKVEKKRSFIKEIPTWNAYIGAGFWYSDIEQEIHNQMLEFRGLIFYRVVLVFGVIFLFIVLSIMSSRLMMRRLNKNFLLFETFFQQAKETAASIDIHQLEYKEFQNLAKTANEMSAERTAITESLRKALNEKTELMKELFHRTRNNMQLISSMINLQGTEIKDKRAIDVLKDIQSKIIAMSLVHEKLYHSENLSNIKLNDYISDLSEKIKAAYHSELYCEIIYDLEDVSI